MLIRRFLWFALGAFTIQIVLDAIMDWPISRSVVVKRAIVSVVMAIINTWYQDRWRRKKVPG